MDKSHSSQRWKLPQNCSRHSLQFKTAKPFPHCIINNFLSEEKARQLLKTLLKERFLLRDSDLFTFFQTNDLIATKHKPLREFCNFLSSEEFKQYLKALTSITLQQKSIDIAGTLYTRTHYLLPHDDQLETRKIAFIYYLSTLKQKDGGALVLYNSKPSKIIKRIYPKFNTFVMFKVSVISFHEVEEVLTNEKRLALSGWFH